MKTHELTRLVDKGQQPRVAYTSSSLGGRVEGHVEKYRTSLHPETKRLRTYAVVRVGDHYRNVLPAKLKAL